MSRERIPVRVLLWALACLALARCAEEPPMYERRCYEGLIRPEAMPYAVLGAEATVAFNYWVSGCTPDPDPPRTVRLRMPSGNEAQAARIEVSTRPDGTFMLWVTFVATEVGLWTVDATVGAEARAAQNVVIAEDLRAAPLERFPFGPPEPCGFPVLTAGGGALCAEPGRGLTWPAHEPDATDGYHALPAGALWADDDGVWVADTSVRRLQSLGDGGLVLLAARAALPEAGRATLISGDRTGVVVATDFLMMAFEADDAGGLAAPRQQALVAAGLSGQAGDAIALARPILSSGAGTDAVCRLGTPDGGALAALEDCAQLTTSDGQAWSTPQGLWLRRKTVDDTVWFVDRRAPARALLAGPKVQLPGFAFGEAHAWMTAPSAVQLGGDLESKVVLLPRAENNDAVLELVSFAPRPGVSFARATATHVFYIDAFARRDLGESPWLFQRRHARLAAH